MRRRRHLQERNVGLRFAGMVAALVALALTLFIGVRWLDKRQEKPETLGDYRQRLAYENLIEVDGVSYRPRQRLTTVLLMGVDSDPDVAASVGYRRGGQADFLRLVVIDAAKKRISQIQLDRDTMTPITIIGVLGDRSGVRTAQLALAHAFGDGQAQSCELTVEAVSNLLLGIQIDFYTAMNMNGISVLNDAVGGVTVTLEDDFSAQDGAMVKGATLTLTGDQAELFVRSRQSIGEGTNQERMRRQQTYVSALRTQINRRQSENDNFISELYDELSPHIVTNLSKGRLINEAWFAADYEHGETYSLQGVHEIGKTGFMQFIPDDEALQRLVLELFYEEVR